MSCWDAARPGQTNRPEDPWLRCHGRREQSNFSLPADASDWRDGVRHRAGSRLRPCAVQRRDAGPELRFCWCDTETGARRSWRASVHLQRTLGQCPCDAPPEACRAGCRVRPAAPRPRRSTAGMGSERHVHTAAVCRGCALAQRPDHVPARAARHPLHTVNQRAALDAGPPEIAEPLQRALQQPPVLMRCRAPKSADPHRRARPTTPVSARSSPALLSPCRSPCPKGRPPKTRSDVFAVGRSQPVAC